MPHMRDPFPHLDAMLPNRAAPCEQENAPDVPVPGRAIE